MALTLPGDRVLQVGRYGGIPAAFVVGSSGQLDPSVSEDGILELPHEGLDAQFFGAELSADGKRIALTTNNHKVGARLVILEIEG